ncbi:unnamed protein product [Fusarium graminearum]|uniref:Chromosome 2, complete genome n=1 Tax=Gibberella zeae (strain ATCC MYA-4620 / CBS 123657 / FGSC 9075 / NRRL 31084 / PH-1) TaxID=229533 RepID=A0A098DH89_GIBZE|nr:unnamed protein product [Fusarium graminearum]
MYLTEAIEEDIGCPNYRRAIPVFFREIMISLDDIYPQDRRDLKKRASIKYIRDSLNGPQGGPIIRFPS